MRSNGGSARSAGTAGPGREGPWRDRIVGRGEEDPLAVRPNPANWRAHPPDQAALLLSLLGRIGWIREIVVNRTTGNLVDGHLRVALAADAGEATVPVSWVELDPEEEAVVLATLDPLAAMAVTDRKALRELLEIVAGQDAEAAALADALASAMRVLPPGIEEDDYEASGTVVCPQCGATLPA